MFGNFRFSKNFVSLLQKSNCFSQEKFKSFKIKFFFSKIKMESVEQPKKKELPAGTLEDFVKIDIRIGEIIECWKVIYFRCLNFYLLVF